MGLLVDTWYEIGSKYGLTLAVLADIHARRVEECIAVLEKNKPDIILIPGDMVDGAAIEKCSEHNRFIDTAILHLNRFSNIALTYYSIGNYEKQLTEEEIGELCKSDAVVLNNRWVNVSQDLYIGGLSSGRNYHDKRASQNPDISFIDKYENMKGFKILLSPHPEYYQPFLKGKDIGLFVHICG